jgi:hypothetical protein
MALGLGAKIGMEAKESTWNHSDFTLTFEHPIKGIIAFYPVTTWEQNRVVPHVPEGSMPHYGGHQRLS